MTWRMFGAVIGTAILAGLAGAAAAASEEDPALTELVQILRNQGVLDEAQFNQLSAKAEQKEAEEEGWFDRISLWGDFRGRYEGFYYVDQDDDVPDRSRLRYRFRLNGSARINDRAEVLFQLVSGGDDQRSANHTLGDLPSFRSDPIRIDRAYARVSPFAEGVIPGGGGSVWVEFGKVPNPYVWKVGKDFMLWDNDINPEGVSFLYETDLADDIDLFANAGYYVMQELSEHGDPNLLAAQFGGEYRFAEHWTLGKRLSWFRFGDVTDAERSENADDGNIYDGLTRGEALNVIESALYLKTNYFADWPITVYGDIASNLSARSSRMYDGVGKENLAWGVGLEAGDKKKLVLLGVGWWHVEANAFLSTLIDSDLFDGKTNRKGLAFYGVKEILPNTEVSLTGLWSEVIDDSLPGHQDSVAKADRFRVQADMLFKF